MKNRTSDPRIPRYNSLTLSHRDSMASEVYNEVHITTKIYSLGLNFTNICAYISDFFGFKVMLMHVV